MYKKKWPNLTQKQMQYEIDKYIKTHPAPINKKEANKPQFCTTCSNAYYCRKDELTKINDDENKRAIECPLGK